MRHRRHHVAVRRQPADRAGRLIPRQQLLLHTGDTIPMPLLDRDANRIRERQHLVRPEANRAIRRDPAQLLVNRRNRNA